MTIYTNVGAGVSSPRLVTHTDRDYRWSNRRWSRNDAQITNFAEQHMADKITLKTTFLTIDSAICRKKFDRKVLLRAIFSKIGDTNLILSSSEGKRDGTRAIPRFFGGPTQITKFYTGSCPVLLPWSKTGAIPFNLARNFRVSSFPLR